MNGVTFFPNALEKKCLQHLGPVKKKRKENIFLDTAYFPPGYKARTLKLKKRMYLNQQSLHFLHGIFHLYVIIARKMKCIKVTGITFTLENLCSTGKALQETKRHFLDVYVILFKMENSLVHLICFLNPGNKL